MFFSEDMVQAARRCRTRNLFTWPPNALRNLSRHLSARSQGVRPVVYPTNANHFDKEPRRVKEIRVFYDDGTF